MRDERALPTTVRLSMCVCCMCVHTVTKICSKIIKKYYQVHPIHTKTTRYLVHENNENYINVPC